LTEAAYFLAVFLVAFLVAFLAFFAFFAMRVTSFRSAVPFPLPGPL